ncbi:MAG: PAS domain-containing protein, partial [Bacteroidota bacterium]|nr:PAS domain-containing protein [Bacteroidota bacterium]
MTVYNSSGSPIKDASGFLSGGGEMGNIIGSFDWSKTPLGPINTWPSSLRTTLGIILKSKFPMVLLWGADYRLFYNDAYRPTLGNDHKHPHVLGKPASGIWEESWEAVKQLIDKVYQDGESILFEDQLIPIFRNGKNEDVYWTFNYSPVTNESDAIAGVFITCFETTKNVIQFETFQENSRTLNMAMEIAELGLFKVDLITRTAVYSKLIREFLGLDKQNMSLAEILTKIHPEDKPVVKEIIEKSIKGVDGGKHDVVYRVINSKNHEIKFFRSIGQLVSSGEKPLYISGIIQDVTQQVTSKQILEEREKSFRNLVMQAPVAIAVFRGHEFVANIVNNAYLQLVDKTREEFVGKPLFESLPKSKEILEPLARELVRTGNSFPANEFQITLNRNGKDEVCWFNSIWEPFFNNEGKIDGFMAVAHEVTEQVISRNKIEESEARFRSLVTTAPVAIGLFVGRDLVIENPNQPFIDIVGKGESIIGKPLREAMPELIIENQPYLDILDEVYTTGKMYQTYGSLVKIVQNGVLRHNYYDFTYSPLFDAEGKVYAILDIAIDVTKQVHDRKKIEESEERYRTLI